MQLTPVYGDTPVLVLEGDHRPVVQATIEQRLRFLDELAALSPEQWMHPSRCEGWTVRDVIVHLDGTNTFWTFSIQGGLAGSPTQFLANFDPVATPAALVAGAPKVDVAELLATFSASTQAFCDLIGSLDDAGLETMAEAPPGHLAVAAVVHHALWDSLVHEHDVLGPLGLDVPHRDEEVAAALAYVAGLGAGYDLTRGVRKQGTLGLVATDPDLAISVEVAGQVRVSRREAPVANPDLELRGDATHLLEALSQRASLGQPVPDDARWLIDGLAIAFDA